MTREIKFRAWTQNNPNNPKGKMHENVGILNGIVYSQRRGILKNAKIMQFTDLKDKNGKEIYEGDIIRRSNKEINRCIVFEVIFDKQNGCFKNKGSEHVYPFFHAKEDEVIGNIYENPELLK